MRRGSSIPALMPKGGPRVHLRELGITARTRKSYRKAIANFFRHLDANGIATPNSLADLDQLLADFINECWLEGEPHGYAGHLLSGFGRFFPPCKHTVPTAWQYFNNWQRQIILTQAVPLPPQAMTALHSMRCKWAASTLLRPPSSVSSALSDWSASVIASFTP